MLFRLYHSIKIKRKSLTLVPDGPRENNWRVLHNTETAYKKSDFCFQLGGKAEFMTNK